MIVLGITGPIASGKSTAAGLFAEAGVPVFNADAAVRELYDAPPPGLAEGLAEAIRDGRIDRRILASRLDEGALTLDRLEALVHPYVEDMASRFLRDNAAAGAPLTVLEVPLLFETGLDVLCDRILLTVAPREERARRAADRGTMPAELFERLDARHGSLDEKRRRADYIVDSTRPKDEVAREIGDILHGLGLAKKGS